MKTNTEYNIIPEYYSVGATGRSPLQLSSVRCGPHGLPESRIRYSLARRFWGST